MTRREPPADERATLMAKIGNQIASQFDGSPMFIGIDGVDGSGKTCFANELAGSLRGKVPLVRISIDGFHKQRNDRYRLGRDSPEGFWLDSYDYDAFFQKAIVPLREGQGRYLEASHDLDTDAVLEGPFKQITRPCVVIIDGIFLHRPELRDIWDYSIFLDVDFSTSVPRMAARDGCDPDPDHPGNRRYVQGQRLYFESCSPWEFATVVIDHNDLLHPRIKSGP